ncbi:unnamed protein product [Ectocarpus sp. 6 AP-2014]
MPSSKSKSSPKTKKYVLLKQPTLLKDKSLSKQGKEFTTTRSPSQWVAMYAMMVYSKRYKQLRSAFVYRKGTVYRYNITFKSKSGKKCASAKLTSRSVCKVTGGKPGKSRSCHAHGAGPQGTVTSKKKALAKSKSELKKARKSLTVVKKRVAKAKQSLCKSKSGTKKRADAKKKVAKSTKEMAQKKKLMSKLKTDVKKKSKELTRLLR